MYDTVERSEPHALRWSLSRHRTSTHRICPCNTFLRRVTVDTFPTHEYNQTLERLSSILAGLFESEELVTSPFAPIAIPPVQRSAAV
ncbi:hypothetical protein M404DRAFT_1000586 [Pisolithus tinctorius Marx 270]|uniref:Uncharacterized protein n=1 Tax=Pisolithus tinctorius Marx 270 TaxID=870435 RepID=A0A0C3P9G0_PISTI|nr:hypothetical protein M404DRAFT_1000586 [Pisolithus tinctorius Marx 270]